jgi:hypothetical protein
MLDFVSKALAYGAVGLCVVCVVAALLLLQKEQARPATPRKGIVRLCVGFMAFSFVMAALAAYVQLSEARGASGSTRRIAELEAELRQLEASRACSEQLVELQGRLREIDSLLNAKFRYEVDRLSPDRTTLRSMVRDLKDRVHSAMRVAGVAPPPD